MKLIRVFPRRTKWTPVDEYAFVGEPPMIRPPADEVHVSCAFTWDKAESLHLAQAWQQYYPVVKLGGPAFGSLVDDFTPGQYIKAGVTFTSRGCNKHCSYCLVHEREGGIREYADFSPGYIVEDNNLLQCPRHHVERVFEMLRYQGRAVSFSGGIDARLVTEWFVDELRTLPIDQIFLACDTAEATTALRRALQLIGLRRDKVRCYVLLKDNPEETIDQATARMVEVWEAGAMPFAQLYQPPEKWLDYAVDWKRFARTWSRPPAMKAFMTRVT